MTWDEELHPQSHVTHWPLGHVTTERHISIFLRPMDRKPSRILVILVIMIEVCWSKYQLISILLCQKKYNISNVKETVGMQGKACACRKETQKYQLELGVLIWARQWVIQKFICITASVNPGALKLEEATTGGVQ